MFGNLNWLMTSKSLEIEIVDWHYLGTLVFQLVGNVRFGVERHRRTRVASNNKWLSNLTVSPSTTVTAPLSTVSKTLYSNARPTTKMRLTFFWLSLPRVWLFSWACWCWHPHHSPTFFSCPVERCSAWNPWPHLQIFILNNFDFQTCDNDCIATTWWNDGWQTRIQCARTNKWSKRENILRKMVWRGSSCGQRRNRTSPYPPSS